MERSDQQRLSPGALKSYSHDIRAILHVKQDTSRYLRILGKKARNSDSFVYFDSPKYLASEVDYKKLKIVADITMIHKYHDSCVFKPTYKEIVCQIPEEYIEDVCAFEIMYAPSQDSDLEIFAEAVHEGYHVFVVRLYAERETGDEAATVPFNYPQGADVPEGMDDREFFLIQETTSGQWLY